MEPLTMVCPVCRKEFEYQPRPGRPPVTCGDPACRRARKARKSEESRRRAIAEGCPPDKHGTATGYAHYRCGCPECSRWSREYTQERRKEAAKTATQ